MHIKAFLSNSRNANCTLQGISPEFEDSFTDTFYRHFSLCFILSKKVNIRRDSTQNSRPSGCLPDLQVDLHSVAKHESLDLQDRTQICASTHLVLAACLEMSQRSFGDTPERVRSGKKEGQNPVTLRIAGGSFSGVNSFYMLTTPFFGTFEERKARAGSFHDGSDRPFHV